MNRYHLVFLFICLLVLQSTTLAAASAHGDIYQNLPTVQIHKGFSSKTIGTVVEIARDSSGKVLFNTVSRQGAGGLNFKTGTKSVPHFKYTDDAIWIRFQVENRLSSPQNLLLEVGYPLLDKIEFYIRLEEKKWQHFTSGDQLPFNTRPLNYKNVTFPFVIQGNHKAFIYLRVQSTSSVQIPLKIWAANEFMSSKNRNQMIYGILFGLIIMMVLYNLVLYFPTRELSYLYYFMYIGNGIFMLSSLTGHAYQYLWPNSVWWHNQSVPVFIVVWIFTSTLFTRTFLKLNKYAPKLDKAMQAVLYISIVLGALSLFMDVRLITRITVASCLAIAILTMTCGFISWRNGFLAARLFLLAWIFFFVGVVTYALKSLGLLPSTDLTEQAMNIGTAIETVLIAFALGDYINTLRKERTEAAAFEMKEQSRRLKKMAEMVKLAENLANVSDSMSTSMTSLLDSSSQVDDAVKSANTTVAMIQLATSSAEGSTGSIANAAKTRATDWNRGHNAIDETRSAIDRIQAETNRVAEMTSNLFSQLEEVDNVISQVQTVSAQTMVLAVNASIEATKAGEHGAGLDVIGKEINQLAAESAHSTTDVTDLLLTVRKSLVKIVAATQAGKEEASIGVEAVEGTQKVIRELAESIKENAEQANQITDSLFRQTEGMTEIHSTMQQIGFTVAKNMVAVNEMTSASQNVRSAAQNLHLLAEEWGAPKTSNFS